MYLSLILLVLFIGVIYFGFVTTRTPKKQDVSTINIAGFKMVPNRDNDAGAVGFYHYEPPKPEYVFYSSNRDELIVTYAKVDLVKAESAGFHYLGVL